MGIEACEDFKAPWKSDISSLLITGMVKTAHCGKTGCIRAAKGQKIAAMDDHRHQQRWIEQSVTALQIISLKTHFQGRRPASQ